MIPHIKRALTALIALTTLAHAQVPQETSAKKTTLPVEYTLTSADGRLIAGTVVSKSATGIKFRRAADGKEFNILLDKLSAEDRTFVAQCTNPPVKMLMITTADPGALFLKELKKYAEARGITMTIGGLDQLKPETLLQYELVLYQHSDREDQKAENYDAIRARFDILKNHPGIVIYNCFGDASTRDQALRVRRWNEGARAPYIRTDRNFIIFNTWTHRSGEVSINDDTVYDQALEKAYEMLRKNTAGK